MREMRLAHGDQGGLARTVPLLFGLSQVPQCEVDQRRVEGEAQRHPAADAGKERQKGVWHPGSPNRRQVPGLRFAHEADEIALRSRVLSRLLEVSEVQG